jgi:thiamine monophosphate synthase
MIAVRFGCSLFGHSTVVAYASMFAPADKKKAEAISDQDSARSRAAAGICYVAVGGLTCTAALRLMGSGVSGIPYYPGGEIPLEFVAGIAGIVVFMGLLQLVIAMILKLRGRQ